MFLAIQLIKTHHSLTFLASQAGQPTEHIDPNDDSALTPEQIDAFRLYMQRMTKSILQRAAAYSTPQARNININPTNMNARPGARPQHPAIRRITTNALPSSPQQGTSASGPSPNPQWTVMPVEFSPSGSFVVSGSQDRVGGAYGSSNAQHVPRQGLISAIHPMQLSRSSSYPDCSTQHRQYNRRP